MSQRRVPVNTYRVQLHAGFTFADAAEIVPYLARLGVTHLYVSPVTAAAPGSTHGYDMADPTRISEEIGGEDGYRVLIAALREAGLGLVVDIVVNHMGIAPGAGNPYWRDVLEHGPESAWAEVFDVDWDAADGRVVLALLDAPIPERMANLGVDEATGELVLGELRLPLRAGTLASWLHSTRDEAAVAALLDQQWYELTDWRSGKRRVNYRRFFEVDDLIGVRAETSRGFELLHQRILRMVRDGEVDGLRIDHPDGLRDPEAYLQRLNEVTNAEPWVVIEKILATEESIPGAWVCDGTTGYDALNDFTRVLVDPAGASAVAAVARTLGASSGFFEARADDCRAYVIDGALGERFRGLGRELAAAVHAPDTEEFVDALLHVLARFDRYRTYHRDDVIDPGAAAAFAPTVARVRAGGAVREVALGAVARALIAPPAGAARDAVVQLQQIMPAIQAKAIEDRAFYRDRSFLPANEVGGDPEVVSWSPVEFHTRMQSTQSTFPHRMLATATHDHKRGEDARARLIALAAHAAHDESWARGAPLATRALMELASEPLHPGDAYLAIATAVATLPFGMSPGHPDPHPGERLAEYVVKALREAGERTSWIEPDERYEESLRRAVVDGFGGAAPVLDLLGGLPGEVAQLGALTSLAQLIIKIGGPGVVDTYQGNEGWDFTLVDPDNRRAPDYRQSVATLTGLDASALPDLVSGWRDGRLKRWVTAAGLRARRHAPSLFLDGAYVPIEVEGAHADAVLAFARRQGADVAVIVAARFPAAITAGTSAFWAPGWGDTALRLPAELRTGEARDVLTGRRVRLADRVELATVLSDLPIALLVPDR